MALFHQIKQIDQNQELARKQEEAFKRRENVDLTGQSLGKRGRKPDPNAKQLLTLRLDPDVVAHFRSTGEGWQTRMNDALRKAAGL
jgi:uncharacterized protein (DUF4415 family)